MLQLSHAPSVVPGAELVDTAHMLRNFASVIAGNIIGGSVLVALVYHLIYRRGDTAAQGKAGPPHG